MPVVVVRRRAVLLFVPEGEVAEFVGASVRTNPWPPNERLVAAMSTMFDELVDAGVSALHPQLVACPDCGATFGACCTHLRTGVPIHRWHKGRKA